VDLGVNRDVGAGDEMHLIVLVKVQPTAAGAATVQFQFISSANANLSSPKILGQTDAIPIASLPVGSIIHIPFARFFPGSLGQRYIGCQYAIGTGPLTAGSFDAFIVHDLSGLPRGTVYTNQGSNAQAVLK
jgi:hypothetical protein